MKSSDLVLGAYPLIYILTYESFVNPLRFDLPGISLLKIFHVDGSAEKAVHVRQLTYGEDNAKRKC